MPIDKILFLLLTCVLLHSSVAAQQSANKPGSNTVRSRAFAHNARVIDSLQSMNEGTNARRKNNVSVTLTGAKLIRNKNTPASGIRQRSNPKDLLINEQPRSAFRTNAICYTISGRNFLKQDSLVLYTGDPCITKNGNVIVCGEFGLYTPSTLAESGAFCMKTDIEGNVIWAKLYDSTAAVSNDYTNFFKAIELADGSVLVAGRTKNKLSGNDDFLLTKLDNNGNTLWLKTYESKFWQGFNGSGDYFPLTGLEEDPATGDIYFAGGHWVGASCVTKIASADGHIIWSNSYDGYDNERPFGIVINSNNLLLFDLVNGYYNQSLVQVTAINKTNGDTLFTKTINQTGDQYAARLFRGTQVVKLNNGHYRLCGPTTRYFEFPAYTGTIDLFHAGIIELDEHLNFFKAWGFKNRIESNGYNTRISLFPDGSGIFTMFDYISGYNGEANICLFRDDQIYHQRKRLHKNEGLPYEPPTLQLADGGFLNIKLMGDSTLKGVDGSRIDYYRIHTSDTASLCLGVKDSSTSLWYFNFEPVKRRIDSVHRNVFRESRVRKFDAWNFSLHPEPACVVVSNCDTLSLSSTPTKICPGKTVTITIHKNKECGSLVPLKYDSSFVNGVSKLNDTTYQFHFNAPGNGWIKASLMGCELKQDSVLIEVLPAVYSLNLGADTVVCPGNKVVLNARTGFVSYNWQDGSTDSIFTVITPGTYYVTAINGCGTSYSDTVIVKDHPPIPLSIGPDRTKCNNDTIQLNGPTGFISYNWLPDYQVSSANTKSMIANPAVDTSYVLRAELTPGCFAFDTVQVTVFRSPVINLGADTGFCQGDSILLNAGTGFAQYNWSNGSHAQQLKGYAAGNYSVEAITAEGCKSFDTLRIVSVFSNPVIRLNPDSTICAGASRILDAGAGYASYVWNTGSSGQSISIGQTGTYSVVVTDKNGCYGYATSIVNKQHPVPTGFLPADTAICNYGSMQLKSLASYPSYQWSTNGTAPAITITQPGNYWLEVRDTNGCSGRDSVLVQPKNCMQGFYIPTAFTPNNDGKNDSFMPMIFGDIKQYQFTVFNRWGQVVFSSTIPGQGWNGNYKGTVEGNSVFAWVCHYQLEGEEKKTERGTVLLIR